VLAHLGFSAVTESIEGAPELLLDWLGRAVVELNIAETDGVKDANGGLEAFVALKVGQLAGSSKDVDGDAGMSAHSDEFLSSGRVFT